MNLEKRHQIVRDRLEIQLESGVKRKKINRKTTDEMIELTPKDTARISREISSLNFYLGGKTKASRKLKKVLEKEVQVSTNEVESTWFIDIYTVKFGYENKAAKKKAGKSKGKRSKMKKKRYVSLVKSVKSQPGLIQKYKDGKMGMSPKSHIFKMRKENSVFSL